LKPSGTFSLAIGIWSAAFAIGGGTTGASFCASSDFGLSCKAELVVGDGSGAGVAPGADC
jgi:hypothetical protein